MLKQMMDSMDHDARKLVRVNSKMSDARMQPGLREQLLVAAVAALAAVAAVAGRRGAAAGARRRAAAADADDAGAHARRALRADVGGQQEPDAAAERARGGRADGRRRRAGGGAREVASVALEGEPAFVDPHLLNLAREGSPAAPPPPAVDADPMAAQAIASYLQARLTPLRHSPRSRRAATHAAAAGAAAEYDADSSPEPMPEPAGAGGLRGARGRLV